MCSSDLLHARVQREQLPRRHRHVRIARVGLVAPAADVAARRLGRPLSQQDELVRGSGLAPEEFLLFRVRKTPEEFAQ